MAQSTFQVDRRPLTTPIQPNHRAYDHKFSHMDESFPDVQLLVDPSLTVMETEPQEHMTWASAHASLKPYSRDANQAFYTMEQPPYFQHPYAHGQQGVDQIILASHLRQQSPFSQQPSFASGESLGPPTESDASPSTPPDTSFAPPYQPYQASLDPWMHQSEMVAHTGGLLFQENPSVNPVDINPSQTTFAPDGVTMSRSPSFGPEAQIELHSQPSFEASNMDSGVEAQARGPVRLHSPLPDSPCANPEGDTVDASEAELDLPKAKHEEEDGEWTPSKSRTKKRGFSGEKVAASSRSSTRSPRKRSKTSQVDAQVKAASKNAPNSVVICQTCHISCADEAAFQKHNKAKHARAFICVFHFAGCPSSFPSKNEWKRHVMTQHLALFYWLCTQGACAQCANPSPQSRHLGQTSTRISGKSASALPHGAIFNRKDLFTQHVRRMHPIAPSGKVGRNQKPAPDSDGKMRQLQIDAERRRCELPTHMTCPAVSCHENFTGANAWDDRMEHVAKHLERACEGREPPVRFGGEHDSTLTGWAESPEVGVVRRTGHGRWELINTLRGCVGPSNGNGKGGRVAAAAASPRPAAVKTDNEEEVDADGDDD